jgi:hypothetical protein
VRRSILVSIVLALVTGLASRVGRAAEDPEALIRQGIELRKAGDDLRARGYFKRAYELARTPRSAAQLGLVELALDDLLDSNTHLSEALDSDDPWVRVHHDALSSSLERVRSHLAQVRLSGVRPGTTVQTSNGAPIAPPANGTIWVSAGATTVTVRAPDAAAETEHLTLRAGEIKTIAVPPPPPEPVAKAEPQPVTGVGDTKAMQIRSTSSASGGNKSFEVAGAVTAGVGLVSVVAGIWAHSVATRKFDAVRTATVARPYDDSDLNAPTYDKAGTALIVGGAVAVAAGATLFVLGLEGHHDASPDRGVSLRLGPSAISIAGAF